MRVKLLILNLIVFINPIFSQKYSAEEHSKIYNHVFKNVLVWKILDDYSPKDFTPPHCMSYVPDSGYYLDFKIDTSSLKFPLNGYTIFSISMSNWKFIEGSQKKAQLNQLNRECVDFSRIYKLEILSDDGVFQFLNNTYLVAYNRNTDDIIYLSGNFFVDKISKYFNLSYNEPKSFLYYLKIRLYNYEPISISFLGYEKSKLWFELEVDWEDYIVVYVCVSKSDFDDIKITLERPKRLKDDNNTLMN